ncbi:MAG TPA: thiamine pyrophosphate-dependent dehydrogenase E1 component subunit alpha, partial [Planctomycetota bacterium]|nr:thiamine pyrophosphate-dependent dehydrogenase E1 component subunit alpha [Planctomycetota bacterium]
SKPSPVVKPPTPFDGVSRQVLHDLYRHMVRTRAVEDRLTTLYKQGKLYGSLFRSLGQEATAVGAAYALDEGDVLCPMIRDLGALMVLGFNAREVFAQYMCREESTCRGKDGIHHLGDIHRGIISTVSMMGSVIPVVAGAAWGFNQQGRNVVGMTFCGDGGTSTGEFHESINLAAVLNLPLVLIIENNGWAYSTPSSRQSRVRDLAVKAQGYGIPGWIVDGNDPFETWKVARRAVEHARAGKGPMIIEAKTYRIKGHAEHDDFSYAPAEELEAWRRRDPIESYRARLKEHGFLADEEDAAIRSAVEREVDEGEKAALALPLPPGEEVIRGVFADDSIVRFVPWWKKR